MESRAESVLRAAISLAKRDQVEAVETDHVLRACLLSLSRFGIVRLGGLVIDLEDLGIDWMDAAATSKEDQPKAGYSANTVALIDRASAICRADRAGRLQLVHLLAAFAGTVSSDLMAQLARRGIDSAAWRAALADLDAPTAGASAGTVAIPAEYVSPEQAAEILGVHHQTIRGYIRSGKLPALRIAGERAVRIRRQSLDRLLEPVEATES